MKLSKEQQVAVEHDEDVYVTACPGSGKTRALTARITRAMLELPSRANKVLAVTFTNRAADEITSRIEANEYFVPAKLWAGTIHSFALEWILRPYAGYLPELANGFSLSDEYESKKILDETKKKHGLGFYDRVVTHYDRSGNVINTAVSAVNSEREYRQILQSRKKIDFDRALYLAYKLLVDNEEIAHSIASIFPTVCVDEVQDTSDLQYGILSTLHRHALPKPALFIVGDVNQSIYQGIGGLAKNFKELQAEFEHANFTHFNFSDNYRSTQRIVDYFSNFRKGPSIISKATYCDEQGTIQFLNQSVDKDMVADKIAKIIQSELNSGTTESEICVIAPVWQHVRTVTRKLVNLLPNVNFDAPALSPFYGQNENFWYTVAKLALTEPSSRLMSARTRWANKVIDRLTESFELESELTPRKFLKIINAFQSPENIGTEYLKECFHYFLLRLKVSIESDKFLYDDFHNFFEKAHQNIERNQGQYDDSVEAFRNFFKESTGIVVNSCHGVKGEEFDCVISFGLLQGVLPNWNDIIDRPPHVASESASKLLYVIASRAKKNLYLIAENGRLTQSRRPYKTTEILQNYPYQYD